MRHPHSSKVHEADSELFGCQEAIGYLFRREGLLRKALTHSSVKDEKHPSNERLEFLGDAILGMVISEYLFSLLPENDEGDLTKVKSVVVSSQTLARLGLELGLDKFLLIGRGIRMKSEIPRSLIANVVEAIIAAVYLDRGMEAARHFVLDHLYRYVEEVLKDDHQEKNYKSLLQQYAQKELSGTPAYRVLSESGPDHSKRFRVSAVIAKREFAPGTGANKKEAEQDAARTALRALAEGKTAKKRTSGRKPRAKPPAAERSPAKAPRKAEHRAAEKVGKPVPKKATRKSEKKAVEKVAKEGGRKRAKPAKPPKPAETEGERGDARKAPARKSRRRRPRASNSNGR